MVGFDIDYHSDRTKKTKRASLTVWEAGFPAPIATTCTAHGYFVVVARRTPSPKLTAPCLFEVKISWFPSAFCSVLFCHKVCHEEHSDAQIRR